MFLNLSVLVRIEREIISHSEPDVVQIFLIAPAWGLVTFLSSLFRKICDDLSERFPISRLSFPSSFSSAGFFASPDLSSYTESSVEEYFVFQSHPGPGGSVSDMVISCQPYFVKNNRPDMESDPGGRLADR